MRDQFEFFWQKLDSKQAVENTIHIKEHKPKL
jgi:hypothetical protein